MPTSNTVSSRVILSSTSFQRKRAWPDRTQQHIHPVPGFECPNYIGNIYNPVQEVAYYCLSEMALEQEDMLRAIARVRGIYEACFASPERFNTIRLLRQYRITILDDHFAF